MSEWWTYRLSDFLMFSARTWQRLFELYNAEVWPMHVVTLGLGAAMGMLALRALARPWAAAAVFGVLALAWGWVGWAFHWQRYATINWAAVWFGVAFAVQGLLLIGAAWRAGGRVATGWGRAGALGRGGARGTVGAGLALLLFALFVQPLIGVALGRPWRQAEVFGIAPDPTVAATLGVLLALRPVQCVGAWSLWIVPLLWCAVSGATAWALQAADAWLMPLVGVLAIGAAWRTAATGSR